jgi:hypothetical protein
MPVIVGPVGGFRTVARATRQQCRDRQNGCGGANAFVKFHDFDPYARFGFEFSDMWEGTGNL